MVGSILGIFLVYMKTFVKVKKAVQSGLFNCGVFNNIHFQHTYTSRLAGEDLEAYRQRAFIRSAQWLMNHLKDEAIVIILTADLLPSIPKESQVIVSKASFM